MSCPTGRAGQTVLVHGRSPERCSTSRRRASSTGPCTSKNADLFSLTYTVIFKRLRVSAALCLDTWFSMSRKTTRRASTAQPQLPSTGLLMSSSHVRVCLVPGGLLLLLLMLFHLTLLQRLTHSGSLSCKQQQPPVDPEALAALQHLKYQRLALQSMLSTRLSSSIDAQLATATAHGVASHSNTTHVLAAPLTLFLGILSHSSAGRQLAREGWLSKAASFPSWKAKFVTYQISSSAAMGIHEEQQEHDDLLFTEDKSSLHQTVFMMQYALVHFDVRFIMKTEETSYVHVGNLLQLLQASCTDATCQNESLYVGHEIRNKTLFDNPGGQMSQASQEYWQHTRLKTYMPYMSGVGYVVAADLAHAVIDSTHRASSDDWLFESGNDDVSMGFWLMSLNVHRLNHKGIIINKARRTDQHRDPGNVIDNHKVPRPHSSSAIQPFLADPHHCSESHTLSDVCSQDWLVLSPVHTSDDVNCLQERLLQCERMEKLKSAALDIAVRRSRPRKPLLPHGKVTLLFWAVNVFYGSCFVPIASWPAGQPMCSVRLANVMLWQDLGRCQHHRTTLHCTALPCLHRLDSSNCVEIYKATGKQELGANLP